VRNESLIQRFDLILRLLTRRKCDLRKNEKATFHVIAFHFELNCNLEEADTAEISVLSSHIELIFCLLTRPKCDFRKVEKAIFQGLRNLTFSLPLTLNFDV